MIAFFLMQASNGNNPFNEVVASSGFKETAELTRVHAASNGSSRQSLSQTFVSESNRASFMIRSIESQVEPLRSIENSLTMSGQPSNDGDIGLGDGSPAGTLVKPPMDSLAVRYQLCREGEEMESVVGHLLVSNGLVTQFTWMPVGNRDRNTDWGQDKRVLESLRVAATRWHHSQLRCKWGFVDNIQRVAGREMVAKVDKDQNVYVDMNELSRHRGWNFTISLEPARADVRIGNDHIRIYPGADRIHINDELVTLPGTVPTQGYGVYLPLRLLQERGYLPSEG